MNYDTCLDCDAKLKGPSRGIGFCPLHHESKPWKRVARARRRGEPGMEPDNPDGGGRRQARSKKPAPRPDRDGGVR